MAGGGKSTTSNKPEFASEIKPFITPLFDAAQSEFNKTFGKQFQGNFIAPTAPQVGQGLSQIQDVAKGAQGAGTGARATSNQFTGDIANNRFLNSVQQFNPTSDRAVLDAAISGSTANIKQQLLQDVLPGLQSASIQQGAFGGGKADQKQLRAVSDFSNNALNIANQLAFKDFSQVRQLNADATAQRNALLPQLFSAEQNAANTASNLLDKGLQQDLFSGNVLRDVGAGRQAIDQNAIQNALAQFQQQQTGGFGQLQQLSGILQGFTPRGSISSTQQGAGGIGGAIKGGLGGAGLGGSLALAGVTGGATIPLALLGALGGGLF